MTTAPAPVVLDRPDGRKLAVTVRGDGPVTVVLEAGMGAGQSSWALVAPQVAVGARTITYDRAGLGSSSPDPGPATLARAADDLLAVARQLGCGPLVVAAHSFGGPIARKAWAVDPGAIAGMVLVDQTDEGCDLYFEDRQVRQQDRFAAVLPALAAVGALRLVAWATTRGLPADVRRAVATESATVDAGRAHRRELRSCDAALRELRAHPPPVPPGPLTVISAAKPTRGRAAQRQACLQDAHARRAAAAPGGRHVLARRSGHLVMFSEPDLVVDEIRRVVDDVGGARSPDRPEGPDGPDGEGGTGGRPGGAR